MEGSLTLTINAVTLLALAGGFVKISNSIERLTAIQEQHEKRLDALERKGAMLHNGG